jgi:hypothetical protein
MASNRESPFISKNYIAIMATLGTSLLQVKLTMRISYWRCKAALVIAAMMISAASALAGDNSNSDFITPAFTYSPNNQFGIMIPVFHLESNEVDNRKNKVVDLSTHKILTVIDAKPGYDRTLNWLEVAPPRWSADSSVLLWKVKGKWFPNALVLIKIDKNRAAWQLDLLKTGQKAILSRTQQTTPKKYAFIKKSHADWGTANPDGFRVDVYTDNDDSTSVSLPLTVHVDLSANPMHYPNIPSLDAYLDAVVTEKGEFKVKHYQIGSRNHWG